MILLAALSAGAARPAAAADDEIRFEGFRRVATLGLELVLARVFANDSILAAIDALPAGSALRFDLNGDGKIDCLAWREGATRVTAIDGRGDMRPTDVRGDTTDDCYLADSNGDGVPEHIVQYHDDDGDGRADREEIYDIFPGSPRDGILVLAGFDLDHRGPIFHLTDYGYQSNRDMWQSRFDGNAYFVAGRRDEKTGVWTSTEENPFCFYDNDGDGRADEAVRFEGSDLSIHSLRWSFDADGDSPAKQAHDYDFSVTAVGTVRAPEAFADSVLLRDGRAMRFVSYAHARDLARWGLWTSALLVWDEGDLNVAPQSEYPDRPRWEGVIADAHIGFPAVGGPGCGHVNKRYEIERECGGRPLGLYFSTVDERVHLTGAKSGEIDVVLPNEPAVERTARMEDANGNGYFDTWSWSGKAAPERTIRVSDEGVRPIPLDAKAIRRFWPGALSAARDHARWDAEQLGSTVQRGVPVEPEHWWAEARDRNEPLAVRAARSPEADRFLRDIVLWDMGGGFLARDVNEAEPAAAVRVPTPRGGGACAIGIARLPEDARDLLIAASPVEMVGGDGAARIAGQVEEDRLWFPASPQGRQASLEIDPAAPLPVVQKVRCDPWSSSGKGIAFENARVAFRTYDGHVDIFTKNAPALILRGNLGDYHYRQAWGMDALDIGDGPGIGDLYIAGNGDLGWVPLFGRDRVKEQHLAADGPLRARIETVLEDPYTTTRIRRTLILTDASDALIEEIRVERSAQTGVILAAVLPPLSSSGALPDSAGIWSFGVSVPDAGEIGLAGSILRAKGARITRIGGAPAIHFEVARGSSIRLIWIAGSRARGDSTSARWTARAMDSLRAAADAARPDSL